MGKFYGLRGTQLQITIAMIAGADFTLFGYDQGVMGSLLTLPSFTAIFPETDTTHPPTGWSSNRVSNVQGITIAIYTLGCFFGACANLYVGNVLGRKQSIMLGCTIVGIGAVIQTASYGLPQLITGRLIAGFGTGINTSTIPTWQSETSKPHRRGQLVMFEGTLVIFGVMISYWIDMGCSYLEPSSSSWRLPISLQIVFVIVILALIPGLPESPRWLVLNGREEEALAVLAALYNLSEDSIAIKAEFKDIQTAAMEGSGGIEDCFKTNKNRNLHRVSLGYILQVLQQMTGVNLVTYYAGSIFENSLGLSSFTARLVAGILGTEYFIAALFSVWGVERFGRRQILFIGSAMQAVAMACLVGLTGTEGKGVGIAATAMFFLFNSGFAYGWAGTPWLYPAEISPLAIRAPANALTTTANWIFNFVVVMITPVAFSTIGNYTYLIFAIFNAIAIPIVWAFYPESKGRSLEEVDEIFQSVDGIRGLFDVVKVSLTKPMRYSKKGELLSLPASTAEEFGVLHTRHEVEPSREESIRDKNDNAVQRVEYVS